MHTEQKNSLVLPRKLGDRALLFVFACILGGFFALMTFALRERTPTGWLASLLHHIAVETAFTFAIFSLLTVVWALFTPRWLESVIAHGFRKVLTVIAVVLLATVFTVLYYNL
jgi:hypothetical protein